MFQKNLHTLFYTLIPADIKSVKIVNGKVEYRDVDGTIKYGKYKVIDGVYCYWYDYREDGLWIPIEMTDFTEYGEEYIDSEYNNQHIIWS